MKKQYRWRLMCVSFLVLLGASLSPTVFAEGSGGAAGPQPSSTPPKAEDVAAGCLGCHGPFEKLASAPPGFVAPSGEKVNPHLYVPHDLKEIPNCLTCHRPHSANPTPAELAALPKPTVKTCFECHHKENFVSCQTCHRKD